PRRRRGGRDHPLLGRGAGARGPDHRGLRFRCGPVSRSRFQPRRPPPLEPGPAAPEGAGRPETGAARLGRPLGGRTGRDPRPPPEGKEAPRSPDGRVTARSDGLRVRVTRTRPPEEQRTVDRREADFRREEPARVRSWRERESAAARRAGDAFALAFHLGWWL